MRAYSHLEQFAGRARFATWLTRIAVHEALARARRRGRLVEMTAEAPLLESPARTPEDRVGERELAGVLEAALDSLAPPFRSVFMLREVEGLSTDETAECLDIPAETVKTRLHRARGHLRQSLEARLGDAASLAFQFGAARCDRIVAGVLGRIGDAHR